MPRDKFRPCPCWEHKNAYVPKSTQMRHLQEIARGVRPRWQGPNSSENDLEIEERQLQVLDEDNEDEKNSDDSEAHNFKTCINFAYEFIELVATNLISITGAEAILKITHHNYQKHLPQGIDIPPSWYMCKKFTLDGKEPKYFTRDFCPKCDYLYGAKSRRTYCPVCPGKESRYDKQGTITCC